MAFTPRELELLGKIKTVMPANFIAEEAADAALKVGITTTDDKILAFGDLVINDFNWWPPYSNFTRETWPVEQDGILVLGVQIFAMLFKQMEATLQDFDYNDAGLTVRVDQVGKLNTAISATQGIFSIYKQQIDYAKKAMLLRMGGQGLGTPKYQSQIGQFLKLSLGSAFSWNA